MLPLPGMMNTIITAPLTCPHPREAEAGEHAGVTPTLLIITAMKIITVTTDTTTTITAVATTTRTTSMMTSRELGEDEEGGEDSVAPPVKTKAEVQRHLGADWGSPSEEALEQAAEASQKLPLFFFFFLKVGDLAA